jgi:hypothetical protein
MITVSVTPALRILRAAVHILQDELDRLIESIEAPWGIRIEKQIRAAYDSGTGAVSSAATAEIVKRLGLEPSKAPDPLPPIELEDVRLVCWMEIS